MCDYSIGSVENRKAVVGDKLVSTKFSSITRGFSAVGEPSVAVCVLPGTELRFNSNVRYKKGTKYRSMLEDMAITFSNLFSPNRTIKAATAIFRQATNSCDANSALGIAYRDDSWCHRDALEFPNGQVVLLTNLVPGQRAVVLQLPAEAKVRTLPDGIHSNPKIETFAGDHCSNVTAPELETIA